MKIGIFDSGLGGLIVAQAIQQELPEYDYIYYGDTVHMPYGERPQEEVYAYTRRAVEYLFAHDCQLVLLACNTASAEALRKIQMQYQQVEYPDRRVLGVLIPAAEATLGDGLAESVGVLATSSTVQSEAFIRELRKIQPDVRVWQQAAPALVPIIEYGTLAENMDILKQYCQPFLDGACDALILGCTHYAILKEAVRRIVDETVRVISQDEVVPAKVKDYLQRHPEIERTLTHGGERRFVVTKLSPVFERLAGQFYGHPLPIEEIQ